VLDGRNRYNILVHLCETGEVLGPGWGHRAGEPLEPEHLEPDNHWFRKFNPNVDGDPLNWVLSKNLHRRHMDESQRAMLAADLKTMNVGRPPKAFEPAPGHIPPIGGISAQAAAAMAGAGTRSVERASVVLRDGVPELAQEVRQGHLAVSVAEKIARLPQDEQPAALQQALPNGHRAIMNSRSEPGDSLDYFPTPPWATRALIEHVLPLHLDRSELPRLSAWEPACGEGHIAEVLREYFGEVHATDIFDYGYGELGDFLAEETGDLFADWIITNPPFADKAEQFVLRALARAHRGVAMFFRVQWLDTIGRYERIFRDYPPTRLAFFAERVPLHKGRWEPEGDTATAYMWLVWDKSAQPQPPMWIAPGQRKALTHDDDAIRFTASPVRKRIAHELPREEASGTAREAPSTGCGMADESQRIGTQSAPPHLSDAALELPSFLKRGPDNAAPFGTPTHTEENA
jgi:hypothetical protein